MEATTPDTLACRASSSIGQSRDRTGDTAIFNRMLYQLSYLTGEAEILGATRRFASGHFRSSRRTCRSCGTINAVIASSTAGVEPGRAKIARRPRVPAIARDIIAAGPTWA